VVAMSKDQVRKAFSRRLNGVLDEIADISGDNRRRRRSWMRDRYKVSVETARKWLTGIDLPDQMHLAMLAADLKVSSDWLLTGNGARRPPVQDQLLEELLTIWPQLSSDDRHEVLRYAHYRGDRPRHARTPPPAGGASTSLSKRTVE